MPGPFETLFDLAEAAALAPSIQAIRSILGNNATNLLAFPGSAQVPSPVRVLTRRLFGGDEVRLEQVQFGTEELLCEVQSADASSLHRQLSSDSGSIAEVISLLSRRFTVPPSYFAPDIEPDARLTWSPGLGVRTLRSDKGVVDPEAAQG